MWTFTIPRSVPSANDRLVNGRDRVSRAMYTAARNAWARDLYAMSWIHGVTKPTGRRLVTIERLWGPRCREWDYDGLVGGCKPVVDAMQPMRTYTRKGKTRNVPGAGLILDDSPKHVTVTYLQQRAPDGVPGTRITISEDVTS